MTIFCDFAESDFYLYTFVNRKKTIVFFPLIEYDICTVL